MGNSRISLGTHRGTVATSGTSNAAAVGGDKNASATTGRLDNHDIKTGGDKPTTWKNGVAKKTFPADQSKQASDTSVGKSVETHARWRDSAKTALNTLKIKLQKLETRFDAWRAARKTQPVELKAGNPSVETAATSKKRNVLDNGMTDNQFAADTAPKNIQNAKDTAIRLNRKAEDQGTESTKKITWQEKATSILEKELRACPDPQAVERRIQAYERLAAEKSTDAGTSPTAAEYGEYAKIARGLKEEICDVATLITKANEAFENDIEREIANPKTFFRSDTPTGSALGPMWRMTNGDVNRRAVQIMEDVFTENRDLVEMLTKNPDGSDLRMGHELGVKQMAACLMLADHCLTRLFSEGVLEEIHPQTLTFFAEKAREIAERDDVTPDDRNILIREWFGMGIGFRGVCAAFNAKMSEGGPDRNAYGLVAGVMSRVFNGTLEVTNKNPGAVNAHKLFVEHWNPAMERTLNGLGMPKVREIEPLPAEVKTELQEIDMLIDGLGGKGKEKI